MRLDRIDAGNAFDWGKASADYARYRDIYPEGFYQKILELGLCRAGTRVLDLGTGTGVLPRHLARYGARFTGADISENQIAQARRLSEGLDIDYIVSPAETLDFPDGTFDTVLACQCFIYFDAAVLLQRLASMLKDN
ncbi:MAG: class I SAM-dependent methyltransferase, partial [Oscillospiraceae bacterium]|nr:class I SAM-dependent methyltransferase [Oscillospiraceae bacterium]